MSQVIFEIFLLLKTQFQQVQGVNHLKKQKNHISITKSNLREDGKTQLGHITNLGQSQCNHMECSVNEGNHVTANAMTDM